MNKYDRHLLCSLAKTIGAPAGKYIPTVTKLNLIRESKVKSGVSIQWIRNTHGFGQFLKDNRKSAVHNRRRCYL